MRACIVAVLGLAISCSPPAPPIPPANASLVRRCPADPDTDGDGIPDRCDACPREPGVLWDDFPIIDGCSTGRFHSLVREPDSRSIRIAYARDAEDVDLAHVAMLADALGDGPIDVVACVGVRTATERDVLAKRRAEHMIDALAKRLPGTRFVAYSAVGDAPAVEIAVLSRGGREERRWVVDHFESPLAAAARARRAEAEGKPSPCGRTRGAPLPPPPCAPP